MSFWNNLGQKASETTAKAMQKAKEMSDLAKLNSMISEEEKKINNAYHQIGEVYVSLHKFNHEEEFHDLIGTIQESEQKIESYKEQIQEVKGVVKCPRCGAELQKGVAFCSSCGAPMPIVQPADNEEQDFEQCKSCGAMVKKGVHFCTACGKPIELSVAPEISDVDVNKNKIEEIEKICPGCGAKNESSALFCIECGTKL